MRSVLALLMLLALGCHRTTSSAPSELTSAAFAVDLSHADVPFAIAVVNTRTDIDYVNGITLHVAYKMPIFDGDFAGEVPDGFDCDVWQIEPVEAGAKELNALGEEEFVVLPPGERSTIWGAMRWKLPDDAPPMLAVIRCAVTLLKDGKPVLTTEPMVLYLQSRDGALETIARTAISSPERAAELLGPLKAVPGRRVEQFDGLLRALEIAAGKAI